VFALSVAILKNMPPDPGEWWKDPATLIALAAAIIALASAVYSASSARTAKKAYRLAAEQDARRNPQLIPYLSDAYIVISDTKTETAVSVTLANRSDIDNSIARAELVVEYHRDDNRITTLRIPPTEDISGLPLKSENLLDIPRAIPSHQTVVGWLVFSIPKWILQDTVIDSYALSIYDSYEKTATLSNLMFRQSFSYSKEHKDDERQEDQAKQAANPADG